MNLTAEFDNLVSHPFLATNITIKDITIRIATAASNAGTTLNVGVGGDAEHNTLFNLAPVDATGFLLSTSGGLGGAASGVQILPVTWERIGASLKYLTFTFKTHDGTGIIAYYTIKVVGQ